VLLEEEGMGRGRGARPCCSGCPLYVEVLQRSVRERKEEGERRKEKKNKRKEKKRKNMEKFPNLKISEK
jgi:hypothetical protein